eukprot:scaffold16054_cov127-Isochrysis_galbana.AAC.5
MPPAAAMPPAPGEVAVVVVVVWWLWGVPSISYIRSAIVVPFAPYMPLTCHVHRHAIQEYRVIEHAGCVDTVARRSTTWRARASATHTAPHRRLPARARAPRWSAQPLGHRRDRARAPPRRGARSNTDRA